MSAYVVGNYTVHSEADYMNYIRTVGETLRAFGGRTLMADHEPTVLEGSPAQVIVLVEFDSFEQAQAWYSSPAYQAIIHFRKQSSQGWVLLGKAYVPFGVTP